MVQRALWISLVALTLVTAGCIDTLESTPGEVLSGQNSTETQGNQTYEEASDPGENRTRPSEDGNETRQDQTEGNSTDENSTQRPQEPGEQPPWPPANEATIRPGVQVVAAGSQCTSNFVFRTPDNSSLFLGLAAHCVSDIDIGDSVAIPSARANGTLAYSGWKVDGDESEENGLDFALVEIHPIFRSSVHPSVQAWGGPTGLATPADVGIGDKVLYYGNSGFRADLDPIKQGEGYVWNQRGEAGFDIYAATPGVPGDSGSGVLTTGGQAAGVLTTIHITPTAGANGVVFLSTALDQAAERGTTVELVTWDDYSGARLPG